LILGEESREPVFEGLLLRFEPLAQSLELLGVEQRSGAIAGIEPLVHDVLHHVGAVPKGLGGEHERVVHCGIAPELILGEVEDRLDGRSVRRALEFRPRQLGGRSFSSPAEA